MSAPKRTTRQSILTALRQDAGIKSELDWLEKAANEQIRKTLPRFRYNGEVAAALLGDLAEVTSRNDWRPPFERSAGQFRRAATRIRQAVRLTARAANGCPTYATIPSIVWESTAEARAERQRIAALPPEDMLFAAMQSEIERQGRRVIDPRTAAPDFLKAMLVYAAWCDREAARLDSILKVRDRRYDRLGPILKLILDVQRFTGKPRDAVVAQLLTYASEAAGTAGQSSLNPDAIRKIRKRHVAS